MTRPGAGLGLAVAGPIVTAHAGRIDVESDAPGGTTFAIEVPSAASAGGPDDGGQQMLTINNGSA